MTTEKKWEHTPDGSFHPDWEHTADGEYRPKDIKQTLDGDLYMPNDQRTTQRQIDKIRYPD